MRITPILFSISLLIFAGCGAANRAMDAAVDRAAQRTGEAVGEQVGQMAGSMLAAQFPDTWSTRWTTLYVNYLFGVAFHSGSYSVVDEAYEPGEWTRWQVVNQSSAPGGIIERAFVGRSDDGREVWRIEYTNPEEDEAIVLEGLFSPGRTELIRLRSKFPGEDEQELPVEEGAFTYAEPVQLTEESVEGATVGVENVTVPAGSFEARHVRYGAAGSTLDWWLDEEVPGDLVRYSQSARNGDEDGEGAPESWVVELTNYGDDAESTLGLM